MVHHLSSWCLISCEMLHNSTACFAGSKTNQLRSCSSLTHSSQQNRIVIITDHQSCQKGKNTHIPIQQKMLFPHKKLHFCPQWGLSDAAPHKFSVSAWVISTEKLALYNTKAGAVSLSYHKEEISIFLITCELRKKKLLSFWILSALPIKNYSN